MYKPGTILTLKNQKDPDPESGAEFPYNSVEVIGQSPIDHGTTRPTGQWQGTNGAGVIIKPLTAFAGNLDEPYGKLRQLYEVVSIPEQAEIVREVRIKVSTPEDLGPTPEEVFAQLPASDAPRRPATKSSPLPDPDPVPGENGASPLGESDVDDTEAIAEAAAPEKGPLD